MQEQNYKNHSRVYAPHFFVIYPLCIIAVICAVYGLIKYDEERLLWIVITILSIIVAWSSVMLRQHYGLKNQDRIIRLEMRLRYFQLTGNRFEPFESKLRFSQIAALRFASDEELVPLVQKAIQEQMPAKEIKSSVVNWMPDHMRV